MNTRKSIFALFLGWSGATVLLTAYFLTLFGVIDLKHNNYMYLNLIIEFVGSFILMSISFIFAFYFVLDKSIKFIFFVTLTYLPIYFASCFIPNDLMILATIIIPNLYFLLFIRNRFLYNIISVNIIMIFIQTPIVFVRTATNFYSIHHLSVLTSFVLLIDVYLTYFYIARVVKKYELLEKLVVYAKNKSIFRNEEASKENLDTSDLNTRQKVVFAIMVIGYQLLQLLVVFAIGFVNNMFIELLVMLPIFWIGRTILQKSWHSDKLWICSVATFSGFYILTKITPPFEISLFLVVALTGAFIYILHILGVKADRLEELEEKYNADYTKYGLSAEMAKFACDWKINGLRDKELMIKYEINSKSTLDSRKRFIKNKIKLYEIAKQC